MHTMQEDDSVAQRYLVEPLRVVQAQQQSSTEIGTREGLKALVDQLYLGPERVGYRLFLFGIVRCLPRSLHLSRLAVLTQFISR